MFFIFLISICVFSQGLNARITSEELEKRERKKVEKDLNRIPKDQHYDAVVDWLVDERILNSRKDEELGKVKMEKNITDHELKRIKAPLSVRERIEYFENMLSPAYKQTKQFTSTAEEIGFHESRWLYILREKTDDPMVKKFLKFIDDNKQRGMSIEVFARRIAGFCHFTSNKIHVPALESYTAEELKSELVRFFGTSFDDFTFDIVCSLKKN